MTVDPVDRVGSTTQAETSIPRARIASSMKRPNASSPTTPKNATRRSSRAAPQAKIADELPTVMCTDSIDPLDLVEDRDGIRVGDDDVRVDLADDEDVEVPGGMGSDAVSCAESVGHGAGSGMRVAERRHPSCAHRLYSAARAPTSAVCAS